MSTVESANAAIVDGLIRSGWAAGMTNDQLQVAGQNLITYLQEQLTNNPLIATYFPALGDGIRALSSSVEAALTELGQDVDPALAQTVKAEYRGVVGPGVELGPLLERELVTLVETERQAGVPEDQIQAHLRERILDSQEVGDARRGIVENGFSNVLGRASTPAERVELEEWISSEIARGTPLTQLASMIEDHLKNGKTAGEYRRLEEVGQIYQGVFYDHDAPSAATKRKWTDWVEARMAAGMSEGQALQLLPQALHG